MKLSPKIVTSFQFLNNLIKLYSPFEEHGILFWELLLVNRIPIIKIVLK